MTLLWPVMVAIGVQTEPVRAFWALSSSAARQRRPCRTWCTPCAGRIRAPGDHPDTYRRCGSPRDGNRGTSQDRTPFWRAFARSIGADPGHHEHRLATSAGPDRGRHKMSQLVATDSRAGCSFSSEATGSLPRRPITRSRRSMAAP
jgi:hypothetical protein